MTRKRKRQSHRLNIVLITRHIIHIPKKTPHHFLGRDADAPDRADAPDAGRAAPVTDRDDAGRAPPAPAAAATEAAATPAAADAGLSPMSNSVVETLVPFLAMWAATASAAVAGSLCDDYNMNKIIRKSGR